MSDSVTVVRATIPLDIASFFSLNLKLVGLDFQYHDSAGEAGFFVASGEHKGKYFRVAMKDNTVFFHFYHPDPNPDSTWVQPFTDQYLEVARQRGMVIKRIEHLYHYNPESWVNPS